MRTRIIKILCLFSVLTLLFSYTIIPDAQGYNDKKFSTYTNMGENAIANNYKIPHLFRQDAPYKYISDFPLVVSGGVEYVPLSMFILYTYIDVNYNGINDDFYLVNNRNGKYISFNLADNIAYTSDGELMKAETKIFYQTRYIPARKVASVLGFTCETYDDQQNGIYAFRISNGKSDKTLTDLLTPYLPLPQEPDDIISDTPSEPVDTPIPTDPLEKLERRNLSLCFTGLSYKNIDNVINTIRNCGITACFGVTRDEILSNPSLVRRLYLDGHTIAVTAQPDFEQVALQNPQVSGQQLNLLYANAFVTELENANNALKLVLKTKSRICVLPYNMPEEEYTRSVFLGMLKRAGYLVYTPTVESSDTPESNTNAYTVSAKIKNKVTGGKQSDSFDVYALLHFSDKSRYYINDIAKLINKYQKMRFFGATELKLFTAKEN